MRIRVPEYFTRFRCIADKCRDSCCIGWEIDVDDAAKEKYETLEGEIGAEIREKTSHGCFPLSENGRCAFLDDTGLCRIISAVGDGYLCDICREHPRYYNNVGGVTEGGLGLGCEEAARMILELSALPEIVDTEHTAPELDAEEDEASRAIRDYLFDVIFTLDIESLAGLYVTYASVGDEIAFSLCTIGKRVNAPRLSPWAISDSTLTDLYTDMLNLVAECESLTDEWDDLVARIRVFNPKRALELLDTRRGLLYYFTHRYVVGGVDDMTLGQRIVFALGSALCIAALGDILEGESSDVLAAVAYSKNIEYSTDNVDFLLESLAI